MALVAIHLLRQAFDELCFKKTWNSILEDRVFHALRLLATNSSELTRLREDYTRYDTWFCRSLDDEIRGTVAFLGNIKLKKLASSRIYQSLRAHPHIDLWFYGPEYPLVGVRVVQLRLRDVRIVW